MHANRQAFKLDLCHKGTICKLKVSAMDFQRHQEHWKKAYEEHHKLALEAAEFSSSCTPTSSEDKGKGSLVPDKPISVSTVEQTESTAQEAAGTEEPEREGAKKFKAKKSKLVRWTLQFL
jgi:hypothetical protein